MENTVIRKRHVHATVPTVPAEPTEPKVMPNCIIRKKLVVKVKDPPKVDVNVDTDVEEIIMTKKSTAPSVPVPKLTAEEQVTLTEITNSDLTELDLPTKKHELTQDEIVEKIEYQREQLIKMKDKYKENDYRYKLETIERLLSKVKTKLIDQNVTQMKDQRVKIDRIVLDRKIPEPQFKSKIDLTGERDDKDPSTTVLSSSRKFL